MAGKMDNTHVIMIVLLVVILFLVLRLNYVDNVETFGFPPHGKTTRKHGGQGGAGHQVLHCVDRCMTKIKEDPFKVCATECRGPKQKGLVAKGLFPNYYKK